MTSQDQISLDAGSKGNVNLIYFLYLIGLAAGITTVIGVIMAYLGKDRADPFLVSHYHNQINIFWKAVLYSVVGFLLTFILIGGLILLGALIWYIVRVVKGLQALSRNEPIDNPASWGF